MKPKTIKLRPVITFRIVFWGILLSMTTGIASSFLFFEYIEPYLRIDREISSIERWSFSGLVSYYDYHLPGAKNYSLGHLTAASRDFPRGSCLRVENVETGASVYVRVNDYVQNHGVILDLSSYAFQQLAPLKMGLIKARIMQSIIESCE